MLNYLGHTQLVFGSFTSVERAVASIAQAPSKHRFPPARLLSHEIPCRACTREEADSLISRCFDEAVLTLVLAWVSGTGSVVVCFVPAMIERYESGGGEPGRGGKKRERRTWTIPETPQPTARWFEIT